LFHQVKKPSKANGEMYDRVCHLLLLLYRLWLSMSQARKTGRNRTDDRASSRSRDDNFR
jgi:hypothetical protein